MKVTELAPAKLNLTLEVGEKRSDGYHEVQSVMSCAALYDEITLESGVGGGIVMDCDCGGLPCDETNLCVRAAQLFYAKTGVFCDGLHISLKKRIPMQAGLGGGSADAAAVLRALNRAYDAPLSIPALCELGAQVGSDVPFCVMGGTALVEGRGELLTRLPPAPEMFLVICKPDFSVSTPELYQALDETFIEKRPDQKAMQLNLQKGDLLGIGGSMCNVFEPVVMQKHFDINYIRSMMYTYGAYGAQMTGSGSAVFGIYDSFEYATVACTMLKDKYSQIFLAKTV